jgi:two-component system response regulator YesN
VVKTLAERADYYQWRDLESWYQIMMASVPLSWSELDRMALVEFLEGKVEPHDEVFTNRKGEVIVLAQGAEREELDSSVRRLAKRAFGFSSESEKSVISLGCGEAVDSLSLLESSYNGACAALDYSRSLGLSQIIAIADLSDREAPSPAILGKMQSDIVEHLKDGLADESLIAFREMAAYLETRYQSSRQLAMIYIRLFSRILAFVQDMDLDLPEENAGAAGLVQLESLAQGEIFFETLIRHIGARISQRRNDALLSRIDRAKGIIRERYGDKNFSLQDICRELYLSTSQFSLLFKEGTDQTFVEYLTSVRMDEAKKLLASTDLKSYEVAERVGYSAPRYFSITFKKHCGMTAMEYRRSRTK